MTEPSPASTPETTTKTTSVADHVPADYEGKATAHLTLASVPADARFDSTGSAVDRDLTSQAAKDREAALGSKPLAGESAEDHANAKSSDDNRRVVVETDNATGIQTAHTVIDEPKNPDARKDETQIIGTTGDAARVSGVYVCVQHEQNSIPLAKSNTFPPCVVDGGHATTWRLVAKS